MITNNDVIYYGLFLTEELEKRIKDILNNERNDPEFDKIMEEMKLIKDMHITLAFFGKNVKNKDDLLPDPTKWGNTANIKITGIGAYLEGEKIMNIGLEVDPESLKTAIEQVGAQSPVPETPHITLAINGGKDKNGRPIAFPKNTNLCTFQHFPGGKSYELETCLGAFVKDKEKGFAHVTCKVGSRERENEMDMER